MAQIFSRRSNDTPRNITLATLFLLSFLTFAMYWWASPSHTDVGYAPRQPVPYSHKLHVGDLKLDCRYCHNSVEEGPHAGIPPTQTCMNCHAQVKKDSALLEPVRKSWDNGSGKGPAIGWKRVHKIPDFAYFNHSAHVGVGVGENRAAIGCETCHGRIDTMDIVRQTQPLSMGWCLECHSDPARNLRPVSAVTAMGWTADMAWQDKAGKIAASLHPPGSLSHAQVRKADGSHETIATAGCSGCHR